jgi:hypothetical protein
MSFIAATDQAIEQGFGGIVTRWRFVWSVMPAARNGWCGRADDTPPKPCGIGIG